VTGGVCVNKDQLELLEKIRKMELKLSDQWVQYWQEYSQPSIWQYWVVVAMLVIPLVLLFLFIDRRKVFLLGFYGYGIHIFAAMIDSLAVLKGLWIYPYKLLPILPASVSLDSSFIPVAYMLTYQYILNKKKNYYIWILLLCLAFAFFVKPLMVGLGLFRFSGKENFFMLFCAYVTIALISKWLTDLFIFLSKSKKGSLFDKINPK
jgi:hypothetical protein